MRRLAAFVPALLDFAVPALGYYALHSLGMSDVWALTVAVSVTGVVAVVNSARSRKVDLFGILVSAELAASVALAAATRDPRLVLARTAVYLVIFGAVLAWSGASGRPMTYPSARPMATKGDPVRGVAYTAAWENSAELRSIHSRLSVTTGVVISAYAALRLAIIFTASSVAQAVWAQEIPGIVMLVAVLGLIRLNVPKLRRIVDAEQARLAAQGLQAVTR
jgi:ABC-type maltose transport system permease subunit